MFEFYIVYRRVSHPSVTMVRIDLSRTSGPAREPSVLATADVNQGPGILFGGGDLSFSS
jgi:hypothetical protein